MTPTDWLVDCVIAAGAFGFGLIQLTISAGLFVPDDFMRRLLGIRSVTPSALAILATLVMAIPLVFRRRFPWPVFVSVGVMWIALEWSTRLFSLSPVSLLVALFTVAYERRSSEALIAGGCAFVGVLAVPGGMGSQTLTVLLLFQNASFVIAVTLAGYALHARQEYLEAVEARMLEAEQLRASEAARALEAERTRESEASRRVEAERVRIARELHDITAHSLSAVTIQAAAAEKLVDSDPVAAKEAMGAIRATAKGSLDEIRAMIGVLRSGDEDAERAPTEGTDRLATLVDYLESDGIDARLEQEGYDGESVPKYIDIALFGIAREAVTNIVRHADASRARIVLAASPAGDAVRLRVEDDGKGPASATHDIAHHGLQGIRERTRLLDGRFTCGRGEMGGFMVEVEVPLPAEEGRAHG